MTGSTICRIAKAAMPYPTSARKTRLRFNSANRCRYTGAPRCQRRILRIRAAGFGDTIRNSACQKPGRAILWRALLPSPSCARQGRHLGGICHRDRAAGRTTALLDDGCARGVGGVNFPGRSAPGYLDFAYLAFTVGMCFQVSDVTVSSPQIRHAVLLHAVLSFVYNTAILAFVLNLVFGFAG